MAARIRVINASQLPEARVQRFNLWFRWFCVARLRAVGSPTLFGWLTALPACSISNTNAILLLLCYHIQLSMLYTTFVINIVNVIPEK